MVRIAVDIIKDSDNTIIQNDAIEMSMDSSDLVTIRLKNPLREVCVNKDDLRRAIALMER